MEITYERKHNESYMVIDGQFDETSHETMMIKENNINALLDITSYAIDGANKLSYKISRKENLEDFIESNDITIDEIARIVINLQIALEETGRYLIDERHILLDKDTLFIDKGDVFKICLCYFPSDCGSIQEQFRNLMELILSKIKFNDKESARQIYAAYDLCLKDDYTLSEIIECLQENSREEKEIYVEQVSLDDELEENAKEVAHSSDYIDSEYMGDYFDIPEDEHQGIFKRLIDSAKSKLFKLNFDDATFDNGDDFEFDPDYEIEEKTVLLTDTKPIGRLVYDGDSNEDDFIINKDEFRIGSSRANDAILKSRTVSGNHAKITREGDDYYITDSNSTNGSFLNNLPLAYRKPYKLKTMDKIRFASESYIFM